MSFTVNTRIFMIELILEKLNCQAYILRKITTVLFQVMVSIENTCLP